MHKGLHLRFRVGSMQLSTHAMSLIASVLTSLNTPAPLTPCSQNCLEMLASDLGAHLSIHGVVVTFSVLVIACFLALKCLKVQASVSASQSFRAAASGL